MEFVFNGEKLGDERNCQCYFILCSKITQFPSALAPQRQQAPASVVTSLKAPFMYFN
jgi:hypothetical protein